MNKAGLRYKRLKSLWGDVKMPKQRYHCKPCFHYQSDYLENNMDSSGLLPEALGRGLELVSKLDFADAEGVANRWGLTVSKSSLERLSHAYGDDAWRQGQQLCAALSQQALSKGSSPRRFVIETDGCYVLERAKATGGLEGREVKSIIIYPLNQPNQRTSLSSSLSISEFRKLAQGLLRQAGVKQADICLGVGDGATWVKDLLSELGAEHVLLDVFHAVSYLDKVLLALGFSDEQRCCERRRWLKGEVDGSCYLQHLQAHYNLTDQVREQWSPEAVEAWRYLHRHAELGALAYQSYKAQGWVIGSGQIEGYNKWAILERMRASGMHWSKGGLNRMAFLRSEFASARPLTDFHQVRLAAFP
jgi:hypothetical protein